MAPLTGDFGSMQPSSITETMANNSSNMGGRTNVIMFDMTKNPVYKLGEGYRTLHRKLKGNWKVLSNTGDTGISYETLSQVINFKIISFMT